MTKRNRFFITGTDTEVGKTFIACAILQKAKTQGLSTAALKPLAAGCELINGQQRNEDALNLMEFSTVRMPYQTVNPIALSEPVAPHIAAAREGKQLQAARLEGFVRGAFTTPADFWLVEGAGGWFVPLNQRETLADLAMALQLPVILVVSIRLGCINHALLTVAAIKNSGLPLAGWVANGTVDDTPALQENIDTLRALIPAPLLGSVPWCESPKNAANYLNIDALID